MEQRGSTYSERGTTILELGRRQLYTLSHTYDRFLATSHLYRGTVLVVCEVIVLLANANSRSRLLYDAVARPSVVCPSSVTLVRPTQAVEIFGNVSTPFDTLAIR